MLDSRRLTVDAGILDSLSTGRTTLSSSTYAAPR